MGKGKLNSNDHYIYYSGQESLRRSGVALEVNERVLNAILRYSLKNERMISISFQGKPFNSTAIQVYAPSTNAREVEIEQLYEDLQDLLELTPKKKKKGCPFHHRGLKCKGRESRNPWNNRQLGLGVQSESGKG